MLRLDYISCALTILSTVLVSRRMWQGWVVASTNSVIICVIGFRTAQFGFVPANIFCLALYLHAIYKWKAAPAPETSRLQSGSDRLMRHRAFRRLRVRYLRLYRQAAVGNEHSLRNRDRIRSRRLPSRG